MNVLLRMNANSLVQHRFVPFAHFKKSYTNPCYEALDLDVLVREHDNRLQDFFTKKNFFQSDSAAVDYHKQVQSAVCSELPLNKLYKRLSTNFKQTVAAGARFASNDSAASQQLAGDIAGMLAHSGAIYPSGGDAPADIIDIGCGQGVIASTLAEYFKLAPEKTFGLDIFVPRIIPENITFRQIEKDHPIAPVAHVSFDAAVLSMVLHHSAHPDTLLAEAAACLRPGGYLLLKEHDAPEQLHDFLDAIHVFHEQIFPPQSLNMPSARSYRTLNGWRAAAKKAGLHEAGLSYETYTPGSANTGNNFMLLLQKETA